SVAAIIMRLHAVKLISDEEKLNLFKRRSARWGAKTEPGDDYKQPELPRLLKRTIDLLISSGLFTLNGLTDFFGLSETDLEMLFGLPNNYLKGKESVVHLAKLKNRTKGIDKESVVSASSVVDFVSRRNFRKL
ncbi:hypothetical protein SNO38_003915, partial [Cronobacter sakazakii]|nr:hypothetical protein [Cronobacter sakazakii]